MATMTKIFMAVTSNGYDVYSIVKNEHMAAHSEVCEEHIKEAISKIDHHAPFGIYEVDLGREIGVDNCVETTDEDDIRMEYRVGRRNISRVVYGREPEPTSKIVVGICTDDDGLETVFTAFYGQKAPKELTDPRLTEAERPEAEAFWATHAFAKKEMQLKVRPTLSDEYVKFTVNGVQGDMFDFGDVDTDFRGRRYFDADGPLEETCQKYGISEEEFNIVAERLVDEFDPWY